VCTLFFSISGFANHSLIRESKSDSSSEEESFTEVKVHPTFNSFKKTFLRMVSFSYTVANHFHYPWGYHKTPKEFFDAKFTSGMEEFDRDWELFFIEGRVGMDSQMAWHQNIFSQVKERNDIAGFVALHRSSSIAAVVFHGSHSVECWKSNFDFEGEDGALTGHSGMLHRGFAKKYASLRQSYHHTLDRVLDKIAERESSEVPHLYFLGHSQGAGMGQLAIGDLSRRAAELRSSNQLFAGGWFLSAPVVCLDEQSWAFIQEVVGRTNMLVQDSSWDITQKNYSWWFKKSSEMLSGGGIGGLKAKFREFLGAKSFRLGVHLQQRAKQQAQGIASAILGAITLPFTLGRFIAQAHFGGMNSFGDYFFSEEMVDAEAFSSE
jgi:hypothetical protein